MTSIDDQNLRKINNYIANFAIPKIPDETNFWMIRTKSGYFYDEFLANSFIALGWNIIDSKTSFDSNNEQTLKENITDYYGDKRPGSALNKCKRFINELRVGDIVLVPNDGTSEIAICRVGKYYEENFDVDQEIEINKVIELKSEPIDSVKCPYKKRRHIEVLLKITANRMGLNLIKAVSNYHGLSNLTEYGTDVLNCLYNAYEYKGNITYVVNISTTEPIKARDYSGFIYALTDLFCKIVNDEDSVSIKSNVSSPGRVVVILQNGFKILKKSAIPLLVVYFLAFGGSGLGFEFEGAVKTIIECVKEVQMLPIEKEEKEEEAKAKKLENYEKLIELSKACGDKDLDIDTISEQLERLEKLDKNLQFESSNKFAQDKTNSKEKESISDDSSTSSEDSK